MKNAWISLIASPILCVAACVDIVGPADDLEAASEATSDLTAQPAAAPPTSCGVMRANQWLTPGKTLISCHNGYRLAMQGDGNLVAYAGGLAYWATATNGRGGHHVLMQSDGNLVVYTSGGTPLWSSHTVGHAGAYLQLHHYKSRV